MTKQLFKALGAVGLMAALVALSVPAGAADMRAKRKPEPRDWPMPADIVQRQVDFSTNMLATPYCPSTVVGNGPTW